jgi:hypothetical protein
LRPSAPGAVSRRAHQIREAQRGRCPHRNNNFLENDADNLSGIALSKVRVLSQDALGMFGFVYSHQSMPRLLCVWSRLIGDRSLNRSGSH